MSSIKLPRKITHLIIISLLISICFSIFLTYKYDKFESDNSTHALIKGDAYPIWKEAEKLKTDLLSGKDYFSSGSELYRSYLPVRTVAFFSKIFNYELFSNDNAKKINLGKQKLFYLIFQSLLYFLILFFFLKKLQGFLDPESIFYSSIFFCLCPSLLFFHSSFHTESIFFSLQLLFLYFIINPSQKILMNIFYGFFLGLMFLQKTVSLIYIFFIIFFFILSFKKKSFKLLIFLLIGYISVLLFVGYGNFKRIGVFYFQPTQSNDALQWYTSQYIISKGMGIDLEGASLKIKNDNARWIKENNIDLKSEVDRLSFGNYQKKYAIDLILDYPVISVKYIGWKSIQTMILNPLYIFHYYYYETKKDKNYYLKKNYKKIWWPINILYSLFIYIFVLIGFFNSFKILNLKLNYLLVSSSLYMFLMLAWVGNSRYMVPSLIYLAVYFGIGIMFSKKKIFN